MTELKASALLAALRPESADRVPRSPDSSVAADLRLLLVDHQDSFVHSLAGYFRRTGANVRTVRAPITAGHLLADRPDLVVLSPGPGRPADFGAAAAIGMALEHGLPVFGVCLGLQAIVEYFGGSLSTLAQPMHGKASTVNVIGGRLLAELPRRFVAGRCHSLIAADVPDCLTVTARTDDGVVMAVEHRSLPVAAVQFHPESILTVPGAVGRHVVEAVVRELVRT